MQRQIFRKVALERLSSPEQLDQLMQVTTPRGWLALLALIGLIVTVVAWSFSDTIPTEVVGRGILLRGGHVLRIVASSAGQVETVSVRVGDSVRQGQPIATIAPGAAPDRTTSEQAITVVSPYAGRVVEVATGPGSVIAPGESIISLEDSAKPLEAVIYMPPDQGKNVQAGMEVQVSPANIRREEYGFMRGRVREVATFPATFQSMMLVLGNEQLVRDFLANGTPIEIHIDLEPDPSTPSGYRWSSSQGAAAAINSGTLCSATVTLSEQRPVNLVIPSR
jgi:hypothetical protein